MNLFLGVVIIYVAICIVVNLSNRYKKKSLYKKKSPSKSSYYNFSLIKRYLDIKVVNEASTNDVISDKIVDDLDLNDVFKCIDYTVSKIGQQYLYFKLRTSTSINKILEFDKIIDLFYKNQDLGIICQMNLSKLNSDNTYYLCDLIDEIRVRKPRYIWIIYLLSFLSIITIIFSVFNIQYSILLLPIFIINVSFHYKNKESISYYIIAIGELSKSINVAKKMSTNSIINDVFKPHTFLKSVSNIQNKAKFIKLEGALGDDFAILIWYIFELIKIQFNIEYIMFYRFIDAIREEKESIEKLFVFIGTIDSAMAIASLRSDKSLQTCKPVFNNNKILKITRVTHPLIPNCIPNDIDVTNKSILLTGSNMAGKTTFIRSIAINCILGQTIFTCFAQKFETPFLKVKSSIRISDNLFEGSSYYLEEVKTIKLFIDESEKSDGCLFVLDEILKGTNTIERIAAGNAILSYLNQKNHIVIVSTHDNELAGLLENDNYELLHFSEKIENGTLTFDHTLKKGPLTSKNAIKILAIYNYPDKILEHAKKIQTQIESH